MKLFRVMFLKDQSSTLQPLWHDQYIESRFTERLKGLVRMLARRIGLRP